jgi:hypothetical protein
MEKESVGKKLRLRKETVRDLSPLELVRVAGGCGPKQDTQCACTTDFSNNCCGPNGSC